MNADTPAREIRSKDLAKNVAAFRDCLGALTRRGWRPRNVLDIRYGLGGWAMALTEMVQPDFVLGFEADHETWLQAAKPGKATVVNGRFEPEVAMREGIRSPIDLVLADFNNLTMMKAEPLIQVLNFAKPVAIIFTDVACSKMHLNFSSYGLTKPDVDSYVHRFGDVVLPDWVHVHTARHHHHAITMAFANRSTMAVARK